MLELLLDAGVPVDYPLGGGSDDEGQTLLNLACHQGEIDLIDLLIAKGADTGKKSEDLVFLPLNEDGLPIDVDQKNLITSTLFHGIWKDKHVSDVIEHLLSRGMAPDFWSTIPSLPFPDIAAKLIASQNNKLKEAFKQYPYLPQIITILLDKVNIDSDECFELLEAQGIKLNKEAELQL